MIYTVDQLNDFLIGSRRLIINIQWRNKDYEHRQNKADISRYIQPLLHTTHNRSESIDDPNDP